jgi:heat shock protein HtpX
MLGHALINKLHTTLLFAGMMLLFATLGLTLAGVWGLLGAIVLAVPTMLLGRHVSPRLIARFYGAQPLSADKAPGLYALLSELSQRAGLDATPQLYYVPSQAMNAFSLGRRDAAVIGITDGMLRQLNTQELTGVLAHEVAHVQRNDTRVMAFADLISRATALLSRLGQLLLLLNLPLLVLDMSTVPWIGVALLLLAPALSSLLQLALARAREFDADLGAVRLVGEPTGLAKALQKIERHSNELQRILFSGYHKNSPPILRTHPQTQQRVARLMALAQADPGPMHHDPACTW